jgi:hypothetical protein
MYLHRLEWMAAREPHSVGVSIGVKGSRVGASVVVVAIVLGVVCAALAMKNLAGCSSMSRTERTIPSATPTVAPAVPAPDVPRPDLDRGQAAPGNVSGMR